MNKLVGIIGTILLLSGLYACGGKEPATREGFAKLEDRILDKFGKDAYFTELTIVYDKSVGNMIQATVTNEPSSLSMGEWNFTSGVWKQNADVTIELPPQTKAADFMFQLGGEISLSTLGGLIEQAKKQLTETKNIKNPELSLAAINFPDNGDRSKTEYMINLEPENGGTTFSFYYDLDGVQTGMNY